jgi:signal transduction histidine kinase
MALDFLAAAFCALALFLTLAKTVTRADAFWPGVRGWLLAALFALVLSAPVALRRRRPLGALAASMAGDVLVLVVAVIAAPTQVLPGASSVAGAFRAAPAFLLPAAYVIYQVAAQYRRRTAVAALAATLALLGAQTLIGSMESSTGAGASAAFFTGFFVVIAWMMGYGAAQRRAYAAQLQDQAASGAVTGERLRIARELHDVVAHSMTVIAVQAGYGKHVIDGQPAQAAEALGAIQATSREALTEMRRMLGVLRQSDAAQPSRMNLVTDSGPAAGHEVDHGQPGDGGPAAQKPRPGRRQTPPDVARDRSGPGPGPAPLAPAPGLADLDRLVARIGNAGVRVRLEVHGERPGLPPGVDLAAFRIVQEALTNVVKHAGVAECRVTVRYGPGELSIEITDDGRGSGVPAAVGGRQVPGADDDGGHGLIGMRERVSLYGGELTAGPRPGRGFQVAARLPTGPTGAAGTGPR